MDDKRVLLVGLAAGAAGKAALDLTTYADMLLRGRPASDVPAKVAERIADEAVERLEGDEPEWDSAWDDDPDDEEPSPRASAAGAVSGYAIGLGLGIGYALLRARVGRSPVAPLMGGLALSVLAMGASDIPAVATGATSHPSKWPASSWIADIVPHLAYGFVTAAGAESLLDLRPPRSERLLAQLRP